MGFPPDRGKDQLPRASVRSIPKMALLGRDLAFPRHIARRGDQDGKDIGHETHVTFIAGAAYRAQGRSFQDGLTGRPAAMFALGEGYLSL